MAHRESRLTCYGLRMPAALSSGDKDDIALARIHIIVLEDEELVDAVLLQCGDLDDGADGADQAAVKHEVLFTADLQMRQKLCV